MIASYQLPDEPPPPKSPPPPENPPPLSNPPEDPDEPDDHESDRPDTGTNQTLPPPPLRCDLTTVRTIKTAIPIQISTNRIPKELTNGFSLGACLTAVCCLNSSASPDNTWMMAPAPLVMPPAKSAARKRGMIVFSMMILVSASVSVPSSP